MFDPEKKLRLTLDEIERLMAVAARVGAPVEPWVEQLATELRATVPVAAEDARSSPAGCAPTRAAHSAHRPISIPRRSTF